MRHWCMMCIIARTESIHFDSPKWIKMFFISDSRGRIILFLILTHFDFYSFWFSIQSDFIHFDSVWFWFVANHDSLANHHSPSNQNQSESKIKGRWIVIHSFTNHFESKANQSESRIKLIQALMCILYTFGVISTKYMMTKRPHLCTF